MPVMPQGSLRSPAVPYDQLTERQEITPYKWVIQVRNGKELGAPFSCFESRITFLEAIKCIQR